MTGQLLLFDDSHPDPRPPEMSEQALEPIPLDVSNRSASFKELLPENAIIEFTKNYPVNGNLLGRLLRALDEAKKQEKEIGREELASKLTIPWANTKGLLTFAQKNGLITKKNLLTPFGNLVSMQDPYFLNAGLLWFLHYLVSSNAIVVIWSRVFDDIFLVRDEYDSSDAKSLNAFDDVRGSWSEETLNTKAKDELRTVLQSYTEGIFKPLGLVLKTDTKNYAFITDHFSIPPYIWLASLLAYRDRYYPGAATLETRLLVDAHFSPGRLFRQNEQWVRAALDDLHGRGLLTVETRLGLDQVRFKSGITWLSAVARHFQEGR